MAAGDKILRTWVNNVWSKFNTVISSFSNGLAQLGTPTTKIATADITNLNNKINQIKADYYLSSETNLFVTFSATQGSTISSTLQNTVDNNISGFSVLKCKNVATYLNGTKIDNGTCSKDTCSNGDCSRGTYIYGQTKNSRSGYSSNSTAKQQQHCTKLCRNQTCTNGSHGNGTCSNGTNSNGTKSNGTVVQLRNSNTTVG